MLFILTKCQLLHELSAVIAAHRLQPTGTFKSFNRPRWVAVIVCPALNAVDWRLVSQMTNLLIVTLNFLSDKYYYVYMSFIAYPAVL